MNNSFLKPGFKHSQHRGKQTWNINNQSTKHILLSETNHKISQLVFYTDHIHNYLFLNYTTSCDQRD